LTQFGWALYDTEAEGVKRCPCRGRFKTSSKTLFIERYTQMRESLRVLLQEQAIQRVGVEYPVFGEIYSEGMYGLFLYTCEALHAEGKDIVLFSPKQVKAHARTFLNRPTDVKWIMQKSDMVEAARKDTGGKGTWNHNEADAYWVARTASRFWLYHDGVIEHSDLSEAELSQFASIHTYKRGKKAGETVYKGLLYREDERFFRWSTKQE
jgi:hypothetical protein